MYNSITDLVFAGIWPNSKKINYTGGMPELEVLGYHFFYKGKNGDLYFIPGKIPAVILYRSDRTSVFDIKTDLEIEGKGIIQNQISHKTFDFIESLGIKTARIPLSKSIPEHIACRCMAFELCRPLEITLANGTKTALEIIRRKFLTGSIYKKYYIKGLDPYNLGLVFGLKEWTEFDFSEFTPTTKGDVDEPLDSKFVREKIPDVVECSELIFSEAYNRCYEALYVMPDTKFEFFINSNGEFVLGDEALTPESSRYISLINFEMERYIPEDKQIIRNYAVKHGWVETAAGLTQGEILHVEFPDEMKKRVLDGYKSILDIWSGTCCFKKATPKGVAFPTKI